MMEKINAVITGEMCIRDSPSSGERTGNSPNHPCYGMGGVVGLRRCMKTSEKNFLERKTIEHDSCLLYTSGMIYTFSSLLLKLLFACTICHRAFIFVSYVSDGVENNGFEPLTLCVQGRCSICPLPKIVAIKKIENKGKTIHDAK